MKLSFAPFSHLRFVHPFQRNLVAVKGRADDLVLRNGVGSNKINKLTCPDAAFEIVLDSSDNFL